MADKGVAKREEMRDRNRRVMIRAEAIGRMQRSMLELVGERGLANVTVASVLERSGSNRSRFYSAFPGKEACLEAAYAEVTSALVEELLESCEGRSSWATGMRSAFERLADFLEVEPRLARGVFSEVATARSGVAEKREEALERLARAVDRGREEIVPPAQSEPPAIAARFMVGLLEAAIGRSLGPDLDDRSFADEAAELLYISIDLYLGPEVARREARVLERRLAGRRA